MIPLNLELGLSQSTSAAGKAGGGDIIINAGGAKQTQTMWWVIGAVAIAGLIVLSLLKRKRR